MKTACIAMLCFAPAAFALNNRSAVSSTGLDTNSCSVASPCRSFSVAIQQTAPSGEIVALDSAGYGAFNIPGPMTISGAPGVHAAITVTSGPAISINAGLSDPVILRNLVLIGSGGDSGIIDFQAGDVRVLHCLIRGFVVEGVFVRTGTLVADDSMIVDQSAAGGAGIYAGNGPFPVQVVLTNSVVDGNDVGIHVIGNASAVIVSSVITGGSYGVYVSSDVGTNSILTSATVERSVIAFCGTGIYGFGTGAGHTAAISLSQSQISYNGIGVTTGPQSQVSSFGNNRFAGNGSDGDALGPIALK